MLKRDRILVIDGSGYFFRAYYAIRNLSNSRGFPTNAVFGFVNMILRTLETEKPTHLVIAFDTGKATFRKKLYPEYKANRSAAPEDLVKQIPFIFASVDAFGIHRLEKEGFEADDVIGTIAKKAVADGYDVEIITGDKDLAQLVNANVSIYDPMKDKRINIDGVKEKFGVLPNQIVDLFALMGDSSDNIPGVSGIGEKTATELIQKFGSLDAIYRALDEIPQAKRRDTLVKEKDLAYLSQKLATVDCEVPVPLEWEKCRYQGFNRQMLSDLFQEMEFFALIKRLRLEPETNAVSHTALEKKYKTVTTEEELRRAITELATKELLAVDTETTSLHPHDATLVGISLSAEEGVAYYIPLNHTEPGAPEKRLPGQVDLQVAKAILKPFLEANSPSKTGQNLKFDFQMLKAWGVDLGGVSHDTLLASYLLDPSGAHNLDALAMRYLGHQNITFSDVAGKGKSQVTFNEVPIDRATEYSAEDADIAFRLTKKLLPLLDEREVADLYRDLEVPVSLVLASMEYHGILVDKTKLELMGQDLIVEMKRIEGQIHKDAGREFNIQSPKQLGEILFDELKLPVVKKTKTGRSTDESVLQELSQQHDICKRILEYRGLAKLRSTYVEGLIAEIHPKTGRVHTHFNQTVAATGRLSSSGPNLQNIPIKSETPYDIRSVFIAPQGYNLFSFDYSQIELRLLAHMSGDKALCEAFRNNEDIHEATARLIFGGKEVSPEHRRVAKTINFGVVYGQTAYGLSQSLKISPGQAKEFIEAYFKRYGSVREFFESVLVQARENGYVTTMMGRRRYLPELKAENRMVREMAERAAINAPIQGTAADLIKKAMISIDSRMKSEALRSAMLLQVHDELVFEVPPSEEEMMRSLVRHEMEGAVVLDVPLKVDLGEGRSWGEC